MAYKKDQGRYARMTAFWAVFLLMADGCLRGLQGTLRGMFPGLASDWMDPIPLIGDVDGAKLIVLVVLAVVAFTIHRILDQPKLADLLIETEHELKVVTWPTFAETWTGTVAVVITVFTMLFFLFFADILLSAVLPSLMGSTG